MSRRGPAPAIWEKREDRAQKAEDAELLFWLWQQEQQPAAQPVSARQVVPFNGTLAPAAAMRHRS
jgi:hypothetical protein